MRHQQRGNRDPQVGQPGRLLVMEVNAASAPVQENTSNTTSGRSTRGIIASTAARSATRLAGSATASNAARCSRPSVPMLALVLAGSRPATDKDSTGNANLHQVYDKTSEGSGNDDRPVKPGITRTNA
ncbi:hypothetical protein [Sphaerisporangium flaviroseum]|uniref:hypothetical protein n=1 Tax=Sphaerisporangium flaviroseum TaxID=509199 RepID=UPI0031E7B283